MIRRKPKKRAPWAEAFPSQLERLSASLKLATEAVKIMRRSIGKRQTPELRRRNAAYLRALRPWLARPENYYCRVWEVSEDFKLEVIRLGRGYNGANIATQCHHRRGRRKTRQGDLLLLQSQWLPVSAAGHDWINRNPAAARELGLLAPVGEYDTWPKKETTT